MTAPEPEAEIVTDNRMRWLTWLLNCEPCAQCDSTAGVLEVDLGAVPGADVTLVFGLCEACGLVRGVFTGEPTRPW